MDESYKHAKYKHKYLELRSGLQKGQTGGNPGYQEDILRSLFEHQLMIKMLHFQSERYGSHKALDEYEEKFHGNLDRFMEVLQGRNGRVSVDGATLRLEVPISTDNTVLENLNTFKRNVLVSMINEKYSDFPGLLAIRDEMDADLEQLKYLLTFK